MTALPSGTAITYDDLESWGDSPCWRLRAEAGMLPSLPGSLVGSAPNG